MKTMTTTYENCEREGLPEQQQGKRIFFLFFFIFLWVAVFSRLLPRSLRPLAAITGCRGSILHEASCAANTVVGFAFMK